MQLHLQNFHVCIFVIFGVIVGENSEFYFCCLKHWLASVKAYQVGMLPLLNWLRTLERLEPKNLIGRLLRKKWRRHWTVLEKGQTGQPVVFFSQESRSMPVWDFRSSRLVNGSPLLSLPPATCLTNKVNWARRAYSVRSRGQCGTHIFQWLGTEWHASLLGLVNVTLWSSPGRLQSYLTWEALVPIHCASLTIWPKSISASSPISTFGRAQWLRALLYGFQWVGLLPWYHWSPFTMRRIPTPRPTGSPMPTHSQWSMKFVSQDVSSQHWPVRQVLNFKGQLVRIETPWMCVCVLVLTQCIHWTIQIDIYCPSTAHLLPIYQPSTVHLPPI